MPDRLRLVPDPSKDDIVLRLKDGRTMRIPWHTDLRDFPADSCSVILTPRMPYTAEERAWFYAGLTRLLAPRASIRLKENLHG
jgi:hypothetical protein